MEFFQGEEGLVSLVYQGQKWLVSGPNCVSFTGLLRFWALVLGPGHISFTDESRHKVCFFGTGFRDRVPFFGSGFGAKAFLSLARVSEPGVFLWLALLPYTHCHLVSGQSAEQSAPYAVILEYLLIVESVLGFKWKFLCGLFHHCYSSLVTSHLQGQHSLDGSSASCRDHSYHCLCPRDTYSPEASTNSTQSINWSESKVGS